MEEQARIEQVSVFNSPLLCLKVLVFCLGRFFLGVFEFGNRHRVQIGLIVSAILAFMYLPIVAQSVSCLVGNAFDSAAKK